MAWLTKQQIQAMGFAGIGEEVFLSDRASYHNCGCIRLGHHVRIDDFCVLSAGAGGIEFGDYIHVAVYTSLIGRGRIKLGDFANLSSRVSIYSSNDDYSGVRMTNPMVPEAYTGVTHADVELGRHVIVGCGTVILPGVTIHEGAAIGALSLVKNDCERFGIYAGVPAHPVGRRKEDLLGLEKQFRASWGKPSV